MPELPEVETTCRGIRPHVEGRVMTALTVRNPRLRVPLPADLPPRVTGQTLRTVGRRAKYLLLNFDAGTVIVHLGMSGSLRVVRSDEPQRVGEQRIRHLGGTDLAFLGMHEEQGVGSFEACSLFSPMFEFENAVAAESTAQHVLDMLRRQEAKEPTPARLSVPAEKQLVKLVKSDSVAAQAAPTRRSFFFGRSSTGSGSNV